MEKFEITDEKELSPLASRVMDLLAQKKLEDSAAVLALHGDLGAGKTSFVKAVAAALGIAEVVTSPTFVIMKLYEAEAAKGVFTKLVHIDAYRVEDIDEMRVLRFEEVLAEKDTIICIEWAEKIEALLPPYTVHMNIEIKGESREVTIS
jgi:tRNA threonylcarbamoyladenosine biosynthesis protein TsaE